MYYINAFLPFLFPVKEVLQISDIQYLCRLMCGDTVCMCVVCELPGGIMRRRDHYLHTIHHTWHHTAIPGYFG